MADNMDIKDLFGLNQSELQQLAGVMSKKNNKLSKKDQQNLLSKISNVVNKTQEKKDEPKKMSDMTSVLTDASKSNAFEMTEQEKIEYRNELKKKIRSKQNIMQNNRKPKYTLKNENKKLEDKLAETIEKMSSNVQNNTVQNNNVISDTTNKVVNDEKVENLDDYIVL